MDFNNISFTFEQLSPGAMVFPAIFCGLGFISFLIFCSALMKVKNNSDYKVTAWGTAILCLFSVGLAFYISPGEFESERKDLLAERIAVKVDETYGVSLKPKVVRSVFENSFYQMYGNGSGSYVLPDVVFLEDLGLGWRSATFNIKTDKGLFDVYFANDTDGKTYLWVDKPNSKEKFVK